MQALEKLAQTLLWKCDNPVFTDTAVSDTCRRFSLGLNVQDRRGFRSRRAIHIGLGKGERAALDQLMWLVYHEGESAMPGSMHTAS